MFCTRNACHVKEHRPSKSQNNDTMGLAQLGGWMAPACQPNIHFFETLKFPHVLLNMFTYLYIYIYDIWLYIQLCVYIYILYELSKYDWFMSSLLIESFSLDIISMFCSLACWWDSLDPFYVDWNHQSKGKFIIPLVDKWWSCTSFPGSQNTFCERIEGFRGLSPHMVFGSLLSLYWNRWKKTNHPNQSSKFILYFTLTPWIEPYFKRLSPDIPLQSSLKCLQTGEPGGDRSAMAGPTGHHLVPWWHWTYGGFMKWGYP